MADVRLEIKTGVTFTRTFVWNTEVGGRRSLAGLKARMQIRKKVGSPVLVELSSDAGHIHLEAVAVEGNTQGVFTLNIPGPLTAGIREPEAVFDIRFFTAATTDGEPSFRPVEGEVSFDLAVTK